MYNELIKQIQGYIKKPSARRKGQITKEINKLEGVATAEDIERLLRKFEANLTGINIGFGYWRERLKENFNRDRYNPRGKWREGQLLSEELPLRIDEHGIYVNRGTSAQSKGFYAAEPLPCCEAEDAIIVAVPTARYRELAEYGWATAWEMPFQRMEDGWFVQISIWGIFGRAWKWWEGARDWYFERHPEYFFDDPIWGANEPESWVEPPPGAAVISPTSRTFTLIDVYDADVL